MISPEESLKNIDNAALYIKKILNGNLPQIVITQGTGQSFLPLDLEQIISIPYTDIPYFQLPTVESHTGEMIIGRVGSKTVAILKGRLHFYEGYDPHEIVFPIRVMNRLGCKTLITCNTAGGLNLSYTPGTLMIVNDHINHMGCNPLRGANIDALGPRFPDMSEVYSKDIINLALQSARELSIEVETGVYIAIAGPSLETPAETRFFRSCGADAIGMSIAQEVIAARHLDMETFALSLIANVNDPENFVPITIEDVIKQASIAQDKANKLISSLLTKL